MAPAALITASYSDVLTHLAFAPAARTLTVTGTTPSGGSMSWLSLSPADPTLLVGTNESAQGEVRLFRIAQPAPDGRVTIDPLGAPQPTAGHSPAHHRVLQDGTAVLAANYMAGTLQTVPLTPLGLLPARHPLLKFPFIGPGPNPARQESSHPHEVYQRSATELLVPDLGADKIWRLAPSAPTGEWAIAGDIVGPPGAGPRHIQVVASDLYVLNELDNTLSHWTLPLALGTSASHHSTQPCTRLTTTGGAAELLIHPAGGYLYATNRDSNNVAGDTIAIFKLQPSLLALGAREPKWLREVHTGLSHIRGAVIREFEGSVYLLAAGQNGGGVKAYEVTDGGEDLQELAQVDVDKVTGFVWL
ncbi:putative isomerase YbhE [Calocera cornea HHB12733]|uniref:Putative isomerase YbhE n=1 Tax=Calocera cornea HHB12733 TaxID=1353952 RepID=A0A165CND1_9BASI|nr:putative isomerase YbhE [Calocera cornea HHB12733]